MSRMIGNQYRMTVVSVDSYDGCVMRGRLSNPFFGDTEPVFNSTMEFLRLMDNMLNDMQFPQPFEQRRTFDDTSDSIQSEQYAVEEHKGALATFSIRILYRQNASWQGTVKWNERRAEEGFRSVLELLMFMNSALCAE